MGAKFVQMLLTSVVYPILKDLAFMLFNLFRIRKLRKEREDAAKKKLEAYEKDPSDENFGQLP